MGLGLLLFLFVVSLLLVSLHAASRWALDSDHPLNEDNLKWPAAGYGSAMISLNCLFGAYSAALLLVGPVCFASVVAGVLTALIVLNAWAIQQAKADPPPTFESLLHGLEVVDSGPLSTGFKLTISLCQLGLAISEFLLLYQVFTVGLGFPSPHAITACLAIACIAYYYCLFGGYQALYRTDLVQYVFIVVMSLLMVWLAGREIAASPTLTWNDIAASFATPPSGRLLPSRTLLRLSFEIFGGFALGIMPILAAPDAWKRIFIIASRRLRASSPPIEGTPGNLLRWQRVFPMRLVILTVVPLAMMLPLLKVIASTDGPSQLLFPITEIFVMSPPIVRDFIVLGMVAAFVSTFDGAILSASHVLLGEKSALVPSSETGLVRYRVILSFGFLACVLGGTGLITQLPNRYALGAFLVGPFAVVAGILLASWFGRRPLKAGISYWLAVVAPGWLLLTLHYLAHPAASGDPYAAAPLVFTGCGIFFMTWLIGTLMRASKRVTGVSGSRD